MVVRSVARMRRSEDPGGSYSNVAKGTSFQVPSRFVQASTERQARVRAAASNSEARKTADVDLNASDASFNSKDLQFKASMANTAPSKAALEVEKLRMQREERRQRNAEVRKVRDDIPQADRQFSTYKQLIEGYRQDIEQKSVVTKGITDLEGETNIKVCVRKRPLNEKGDHILGSVLKDVEIRSNNFDVVTTKTASFPDAVVTVHEPKTRVDLTRNIENHQFSLDDVFDETATNFEVYQGTGKPLVSQLFEEGGRCTYIAYGQTGSGKTHTIFGSELDGTGSKSSSGKTQDIGIYQYIGQDIFRYLHFYNEQNVEHPLTVRTCFFEIYGGKIYDLAHSKNKVTLLEDSQGNMQIQGLTAHHTPDLPSLLNLIQTGNQERAKGVTEANRESSRSHAIFQISLARASRTQYTHPTVNLGAENDVFGKLSIIDLAGSERGADTMNVERQARIEGAEINKSLLALKECIRALSISQRRVPLGSATIGAALEPAKHVPFRASKLTQVLRDSFVGPQSRTVLIATISPGSNSCEHTLNTLRYAARIKDFRVQQVSSELASEKTRSDVDIRVKMKQALTEKLAEANVDQSLNNVEVARSPGTDRARKSEKRYQRSVGQSDLKKVSVPKQKGNQTATPYLRKTEPETAIAGGSQQQNIVTDERDSLYKHLQRTVAELVNDESDLIKTHISVLQANIDIAREEEELLMEVSKSEYDMAKYTQGLINILERKISMYRDLDGKVKSFSAKMVDEETTARKLEEVQSRDFF